MIVFSIACLVVIIIILTHLLNWMWRKINWDDSLVILGVIAIFVYCIIVYRCIEYIIIWGQALHLQ